MTYIRQGVLQSSVNHRPTLALSSHLDWLSRREFLKYELFGIPLLTYVLGKHTLFIFVGPKISSMIASTRELVPSSTCMLLVLKFISHSTLQPLPPLSTSVSQFQFLITSAVITDHDTVDADIPI